MGRSTCFSARWEEYSMAKVTDVVAQLAAPVVEQAGCSLWDVE